jgi:predicted Zn finger-like uncharacterized protein
MIVRCPKCGTRYRISAAQLAGRTRTRLRCTQCETRFAPDLSAADPTAAWPAVADATVTGSHSAVAPGSSALPGFGGQPLPHDSGAVPALGEPTRITSAATGVLPARPRLGAEGGAPAGLPRFGTQAQPAAAPAPAPGPAGFPATSALPAFGAASAGPAASALPAFGGAAHAPPSSPAGLSAGPFATGALPAFGGARAPRATVAPAVPPRDAGMSALPPSAGLSGYGSDPSGAAGPRGRTPVVPLPAAGFGGARITAPSPAVGSGAALGRISLQPAGGSHPLPGGPGAPSAAHRAVTRPTDAIPSAQDRPFDPVFGGDLFASVPGVPSPDNELPTRVVDFDHVQGPAPGMEGVGAVDPMLEFRDVFREAGARPEENRIRRFIEATAHGEAGAPAPVEPPAGFGFPTGNYASASLRSSQAPLAVPSSGPITEESALLDVALLASGLSEPAASAEPDAEQLERERVIGLDVAGDAVRRDAAVAAGGAGPVLLAVTTIVLGAALFLGFVAARNGGVLDLARLDQAVATAFRGEAADPGTTGRAWAAQPVDGALRAATEQIPGGGVAVSEVSTGWYGPEDRRAVVVAGTAANVGDVPLRAIGVEVELLDADGALVARRAGVAGAEIAESELVGDAPLDEVHAQVAARAAQVVVPAGQRTRFSVAFDASGLDPEEPLRWRARPIAAEREAAGTCWGPVEFRDAPSTTSADAAP